MFISSSYGRVFLSSFALEKRTYFRIALDVGACVWCVCVVCAWPIMVNVSNAHPRFYCLIFIFAAINMDKIGLLFDLISRIVRSLTMECQAGVYSAENYEFRCAYDSVACNLFVARIHEFSFLYMRA